MIRIFCTQKLASILKDLPEVSMDEVIPTDKWIAGLTVLEGEFALVLMCLDSRFGFLIWGLREAQLLQGEELFEALIRKMLEYYGIRREITEDLLSRPPMLCTGMGKKEQAVLNHVIMEVSQMEISSEKLPALIPLERASSRSLISAMGKPSSVERMVKQLQERYVMPPICRSAFRLMATLDLKICRVTRTLLVPDEYTFADLSLALCAAFAWEPEHDHAFEVEGIHIGNGQGRESPATALTAFLSEGTMFSYLYGSSWHLSLLTEKVISDYDRPFARCVCLDGFVPPESCGGPEQYVKMVEAASDPEHPDHEKAKKAFGYIELLRNDSRLIDQKMKSWR